MEEGEREREVGKEEKRQSCLQSYNKAGEIKSIHMKS